MYFCNNTYYYCCKFYRFTYIVTRFVRFQCNFNFMVTTKTNNKIRNFDRKMRCIQITLSIEYIWFHIRLERSEINRSLLVNMSQIRSKILSMWWMRLKTFFELRSPSLFYSDCIVLELKIKQMKWKILYQTW